MPGEYLKGFPDPPNSPNEKFLLPQTPHLWQDDLYRDLINNGAPHELALAISRSIAQHEDRKALVEQHAQKQLEWWANVHTHPGGSGEREDIPFDAERFVLWTGSASSLRRHSAVSLGGSVETISTQSIMTRHIKGSSIDRNLAFVNDDRELYTIGVDESTLEFIVDISSYTETPDSDMQMEYHNGVAYIPMFSASSLRLLAVDTQTKSILWNEFWSTSSGQKIMDLAYFNNYLYFVEARSGSSASPINTLWIVRVDPTDGSRDYLFSEPFAFYVTAAFNPSDTSVTITASRNSADLADGGIARFSIPDGNMAWEAPVFQQGNSGRRRGSLLFDNVFVTIVENGLEFYDNSDGSFLGHNLISSSNEPRMMCKSPDGSKIFVVGHAQLNQIDPFTRSTDKDTSPGYSTPVGLGMYYDPNYSEI